MLTIGPCNGDPGGPLLDAHTGKIIGIADLAPEKCDQTWSVHIDISKICPQINACCNPGKLPVSIKHLTIIKLCISIFIPILFINKHNKIRNVHFKCNMVFIIKGTHTVSKIEIRPDTKE